MMRTCNTATKRKQKVGAVLIAAALAFGFQAARSAQSDAGHEGHAHAAATEHDHAGHDHAGHQETAAENAPHADEHAHDEHAHEEGEKKESAEADHDGHGGDGDHHGEEHSDEATLSAEAIKTIGLRMEPVRKRVLSAVLSVPGRVSYDLETMAHVGTPVQGRVAEIKVRLGDKVKKGQTLLVLDSSALGEAQSEFLRARTEEQVASSARETALESAERAVKLYEGQGLSLSEKLRREGEMKAAKGEWMKASAASEAAESKLKMLGMTESQIEMLAETGSINPRCIIAAPLNGWVIEREATLGEMAHPESEKLLVLADVEHLWVLADVPAAKLGRLEIGSSGQIVPSKGAEPVIGKLAYIGPDVHEASQMAQVRLKVESVGGALKPGMFVQVGLQESTSAGEEAAGVLAVPAAALQNVEGGPAVFVPVAGEENTFAKRAVMVGETKGGWTAILSGLEESEEVVTIGAFMLKAELGKAGAAHEH